MLHSNTKAIVNKIILVEFGVRLINMDAIFKLEKMHKN